MNSSINKYRLLTSLVLKLRKSAMNWSSQKVSNYQILSAMILNSTITKLNRFIMGYLKSSNIFNLGLTSYNQKSKKLLLVVLTSNLVWKKVKISFIVTSQKNLFQRIWMTLITMIAKLQSVFLLSFSYQLVLLEHL